MQKRLVLATICLVNCAHLAVSLTVFSVEKTKQEESNCTFGARLFTKSKKESIDDKNCRMTQPSHLHRLLTPTSACSSGVPQTPSLTRCASISMIFRLSQEYHLVCAVLFLLCQNCSFFSSRMVGTLKGVRHMEKVRLAPIFYK